MFKLLITPKKFRSFSIYLFTIILTLASANINAQSFVYTMGNTTTPSPLNTDLLQTSATIAASSGTFTNEGTGGLPMLTNGNTINGNGNKAAIGDGASITYSFDVSVNSFGYDLTLLNIYAGWVDNGRVEPNVSVSYALASDPFTFISLATAAKTGGSGPNPWTISTFTTPGIIASGVASIKFDFGNQQNGYVGYAEFDVDGTPTPAPVPATVTLIGSNTITTYGQTVSISGIVGPTGAPQGLNFSVSPMSIATIDGTGILTPLMNGVVTVTATSVNVSSVSGMLVVSISGQAPDMIVLSAPGFTTYGADIQLAAIITPAEADQNIVWSTSDSNIGTVNSITGLFTPLAAGTVSVMGVSLVNSAVQGVAIVTIPGISATSGTIQANSNQIITYAGSVTITSSVLPANATDKNVILSFMPSTMLGISINTATGVLSTDGSANGVVTISGNIENSWLLTNTQVISISGQNASSLSISPAVSTLTGVSQTFTADITPATANNQVIWSVSDPSKASINSITGVLTPLDINVVVTVTATAVKGGASATATIYLPAGILTGATVTITSSILVGETALATVNYTPLSASGPVSVLWSSSDPFLATIDANGSVTGMFEGFVTITATVYNAFSTVTGTADFFVVTPIIFVPQNDITISGANTLTVGGTATYAAILLSTISGTVNTVWSTSDTAVAQISNSGMLRAKTTGFVTVTGIVTNGTTSLTGNLFLTIVAAPTTPVDTTITNPQPTITGINKGVLVTSVSIYPNPASTQLQIKTDGIVEILIVNAQGTVVYFQTNSSIINVANFAKGLYTVVVKTVSGTGYTKLVLE